MSYNPYDDQENLHQEEPVQEQPVEEPRCDDAIHAEENPVKAESTASQPQESSVNPAPVRAKRAAPTYLSRRAAAISIAACMVVSCALGFAGGMLARGGEPVAADAASQGTSLEATQTALEVQNTGDTLTVAEIAAKVGNSVVEITTEQVAYSSWMQEFVATGAGSGVIVTADGYILTNNHVIEDAKTITVTLKDGSSYEAELVGTDPQTDVAVIKIDAMGLTPAALGDSDSLVVGELAVAVGNPLGQLGGTVTDGIISALDRKITIEGETMNLLQTNAAINPGNSGGGLFNGQGELIGIVNAKTSETGVEGLGFAIPINDVKDVMEQLMDQGYVSGRIDPGFTLLDITTQQEAAMYRVERIGVYVYSVDRGSDAANAGFESGDCIMALDGTEVPAEPEVEELLKNYNPGDQIVFSVQRGSTQGTITMTLTEQVPDTTGGFQQN